MMLRFSDNVTIDTSGELRKLKLKDGWYVVGQGCSIPVDSEAEAVEVIKQMTGSKK